MQLILKKYMEKLGDVGDVVSVNDGYARNFLIPRGFAEISSPEKVSMIKKLKEKQKLEAGKRDDEVKALAEKLKETSCTVTVQAGEEDKLYGTVTPADISKVLSEEGINVPKKKIILDEPIKKLGIYSVNVKLAPGTTVSFKLWVVKE